MNPSHLIWLGVLGILLGGSRWGSAWLLVLSALVFLTGVIWALICFVFSIDPKAS